ncbi:MAG: urease accessory protein UreE [Oscillospiraceae bacterium]|jgi:urease accessory protein|nr:urease accessory protein UreE [Oscillospiraceae bacterium]
MTDHIDFEWFELDKRIARKTSHNGDDVALRLTERVRDGAELLANGTRYVAKVLPCKLLRIRAESAEELGRICYELGNRHLPIAIGSGFAATPYDHVLEERLRKLGFTCELTTEVFGDFIGGGHSHG